MRHIPIGFLRLVIPLATIVAGSACNLTIAARTTATPQVIVNTPPGATESTPMPTYTQVPMPTFTQVPKSTLTLAWTVTPQPTATSTPTATVASITMTAGQVLSCVKGPNWILYEWVASIPKGDTVTLLARASSDWKDYYFVQKSDGTTCWAFGGSSTISGDPSRLPIKDAPPLPAVKYTIENKTRLSVCDVFLRVKGSSDWGADRLGAGNIAPGAKVALGITAGFYDVRIKDCNSGVLYETAGKAIGSDANSHYTLLANQIQFYILNSTATDICQITVVPHDGSASIDLFKPADGTITHGQKAVLKVLAGIYDINLYQCGSLAVFYTFPNAYIGPPTTGFTAS